MLARCATTLCVLIPQAPAKLDYERVRYWTTLKSARIPNKGDAEENYCSQQAHQRMAVRSHDGFFVALFSCLVFASIWNENVKESKRFSLSPRHPRLEKDKVPTSLGSVQITVVLFVSSARHTKITIIAPPLRPCLRITIMIPALYPTSHRHYRNVPVPDSSTFARLLDSFVI